MFHKAIQKIKVACFFMDHDVLHFVQAVGHLVLPGKRTCYNVVIV